MAQPNLFGVSLIILDRPEPWRNTSRHVTRLNRRSILIRFKRPGVSRLWLAAYFTVGRSHFRMKIEPQLLYAKRNWRYHGQAVARNTVHRPFDECTALEFGDAVNYHTAVCGFDRTKRCLGLISSSKVMDQYGMYSGFSPFEVSAPTRRIAARLPPVPSRTLHGCQ